MLIFIVIVNIVVIGIVNGIVIVIVGAMFVGVYAVVVVINLTIVGAEVLASVWIVLFIPLMYIKYMYIIGF